MNELETVNLLLPVENKKLIKGNSVSKTFVETEIQ